MSLGPGCCQGFFWCANCIRIDSSILRSLRKFIISVKLIAVAFYCEVLDLFKTSVGNIVSVKISEENKFIISGMTFHSPNGSSWKITGVSRKKPDFKKSRDEDDWMLVFGCHINQIDGNDILSPGLKLEIKES